MCITALGTSTGLQLLRWFGKSFYTRHLNYRRFADPATTKNTKLDKQTPEKSGDFFTFFTCDNSLVLLVCVLYKK
jgi:hypothetical protein